MTLNELKEGQHARIVSLSSHKTGIELKLREIGFCEGDEVELLRRGPIGREPLAIRLNRKIFALRSEEARLVEVEAD